MALTTLLLSFLFSAHVRHHSGIHHQLRASTNAPTADSAATDVTADTVAVIAAFIVATADLADVVFTAAVIPAAVIAITATACAGI